nr:protein-L-isoaspartate(D-aspartate) O-methyltransferase [Candidatus Anammoximicrobium sp.]
MMTRNVWVLAACLASVAAPQPAAAQTPAQFEQARRYLVEQIIMPDGVKDPRVLRSMRTTPRHEFVPRDQRASAYYDMGLPIGEGQTISSPFIVAFMTEQLDPQREDR